MIDRQTGYPSVDKPWLKYYTEEQINTPLPDCSLYEYLWECNKEHLNDFALNYFGNKITYRRLFSLIDEAARAFTAIGVKEKEIVPVVTVSTVASIVTFYALNKIGAILSKIYILWRRNDGFRNRAGCK
ncbi:MAG: AMP-binding protein [Lachnospiraceae bacterium]|nr:AMP-binding protein [Lachnospiraceae bacterium]